MERSDILHVDMHSEIMAKEKKHIFVRPSGYEFVKWMRWPVGFDVTI